MFPRWLNWVTFVSEAKFYWRPGSKNVCDLIQKHFLAFATFFSRAAKLEYLLFF